MRPMRILQLVSLAATTVCLAVFLILGFANFKKEKKRSFSFLSYFPFEIEEGKGTLSVMTEIASFATSLFVGAFSSALLWDSSFQPFWSLAIVMVCIGLTKAVLQCLLFRVPAYHFKSHISLVAVSFCLNALSSFVMGLFFLNTRSVEPASCLTFMALEWVFAFANLFLILNPKLAHWTEMKTEVNEDGTTVAKRPRPFVLAFSEWLGMGIDFLSGALFVIGLFFYSLS